MNAPNSYCIDGWTFWELIMDWWTGWTPPVPMVLMGGHSQELIVDWWTGCTPPVPMVMTGGHSENSLWSGELDERPQFLWYWWKDILRTHCGVVNSMNAPSSYCIDGWTFWELIMEWRTGWTPPVPMVLTGGHSENSLWSGELDERPQFLWYWWVDILKNSLLIGELDERPQFLWYWRWTFWELIVEWWTGWTPLVPMVLMGGHSQELIVEWWTRWTSPVPMALTSGHSENSLWRGELDEGPQFLWYWWKDILRTHCGVMNWMNAPSSYGNDGWTFWELIVEWWTRWTPPVPMVLMEGHSENSLWSGELDERPQFLLYWWMDILRTHCGVANWMNAPSSYGIDGWTFWELIVEWWTGWTSPVPMVLMGGHSENSLWSVELDEGPQFLWYWRVDILRTHCGVVNWMNAPSNYVIDGWTFWELIVEWRTGWRPPVPIVLTGGHFENSLWSGELDERPQFLLYWRVDILRTHCGVVNWMNAPSSYCIDGWTFWELIVEWWTGWTPQFLW